MNKLIKIKLKKLFKKLFHQHKWRTIKSTRSYDHSFVMHGGKPFYSYTIIQCRCVECGAWKSFKIK
jgi:hypothetical protein